MKLKALLFVKLLSSKHFSCFFCLFIRAFLTGYWLKSNMMEKRFDLPSVNCCIALVLRASLRMLGVFIGSVAAGVVYWVSVCGFLLCFKRRYNLELFST